MFECCVYKKYGEEMKIADCELLIPSVIVRSRSLSEEYADRGRVAMSLKPSMWRGNKQATANQKQFGLQT